MYMLATWKTRKLTRKYKQTARIKRSKQKRHVATSSTIHRLSLLMIFCKQRHNAYAYDILKIGCALVNVIHMMYLQGNKKNTHTHTRVNVFALETRLENYDDENKSGEYVQKQRHSDTGISATKLKLAAAEIVSDGKHVFLC